MTYILGISSFYHDSAAALIKDAEIIAAAQEERFTRIKHDSSFPFNAIEYVLGERKINKDESYSAYIVGIRTKDGELIIIACSANIKDGSAIYKLRWGIETLFKSLKTGCFCLEDTNIVDLDKLRVLFPVEEKLRVPVISLSSIMEVMSFDRL